MKTKILFHISDEEKHKLQVIADVTKTTMSGVLRNMINQAYDGLVVSVPVVGSISSKGITIDEELDRR